MPHLHMCALDNVHHRHIMMTFLIGSGRRYIMWPGGWGVVGAWPLLTPMLYYYPISMSWHHGTKINILGMTGVYKKRKRGVDLLLFFSTNHEVCYIIIICCGKDFTCKPTSSLSSRVQAGLILPLDIMWLASITAFYARSHQWVSKVLCTLRKRQIINGYKT